MPVTDSAVQITVNVVDGDSGEVIARIENSLNQLGAAGAGSAAKMAESMKGMAGGAKEAKTEVEELASEFTGGESSLRTMNAEIRSLQGSIYGDTRATAEFLALFPKIGEAMELAFPVFGAIAMIGVLVQAGEKVHELYEKWFDVGEAVQKYEDKAAEAAQQKLFDSGDLESQLTMLQDVNRQLDQLHEKFQKSTDPATAMFVSPGGITAKLLGMDPKDVPYFSPDDAKRMASLQTESDAQTLKRMKDEYDADLQRSRDEEKVAEARAPEYRRPAIEREYADRQADLEQMYTARRDNYQFDIYNRGKALKDQKFAPPDDGWRQAQLAKEKAQADFEQKDIERQRSNAEELRKLKEQALESGLRGEALYHAQMDAAIEDLKEKGMASAEAVNAVKEKYHNEEMRRLEDERNAVDMFAAHAALTGMTGIAKTQAQGDIEVGRIRGDRNLSDADKQAEIGAAQRQTQAEIVQQQRQFSEQVDQIADQSAAHQISGFARIRSEETKQLDALKKKFDEVYGGIDHTSPEYQQGLAQLHRGQSAIRGGADQQTADLARKNAEETEQIEEQARLRSLSAEKQKTAAIEEEYKQRTQKYLDELNARDIGWDNYSARIKAAQEVRDAELEEAAKESQQKMASEFTGFFKGMNHPLQELASLGEKEAGQAAAEMMTRLQQHVSHGGSTETHSSILGGIFGSHPAHVENAVHGAVSDEKKMFAISAAEIHVGTASFLGGGSTTASFLGGAGLPARGVPTGAAGFTGFGGTSGFGGGSGFGFGGAGAGTAPEAAAHTSDGAMPSTGAGGAGILGNLNQGMDLTKSAMGLFGAKKPSGLETTDPTLSEMIPNADGSTNPASQASGLSGFMGKASGAAGGALGLFSAFEGNGGVGGALSGAMSGMKLGMELGGPVGAAVGAAAGAIVGAIGFGGREKAHVYDLKQVRPRIKADQDSYAQGGMDYLSAYSDMQSLDMEAKKTTNKMGPAAESYYQDTIKKEIQRAEQQFTREQKAGRSMYTASAASYDVGSDFVPQTGWNLNHQGERIIPSDQNERITRALESGPTVMPAQLAGGGETHLHVHAIDAKSAVQFLQANKHHVRAALNASYAENSGGSDA